MKRGIVLIFMLVIVSKLPAQSVQDDVVYLKNGGAIQGQIIEQIPGVSVKIKTRDGKIFEYKWEDIKKISRTGGTVKEIKGKKSPIKAFLLSLIFPGLGQYYNGEYWKGIIQDALYIGGAILTYKGVLGLNLQSDDGENTNNSGSDSKLTSIGISISLAAALWSIIDAPISAIKNTRRIYPTRTRIKNWGDQ